jgi:outer membrane protein OmpA-like peptidoglycan-associated protein
MKTNYRFLMITITAITAAACASGPKRVDFPPGTNPQVKVSELRDRVSDDRQKQYDVLSPADFEQASQYLADAQRDINDGKSADRTLEDAGNAAARLQWVEKNAVQHQEELSPILTARQSAIDAHAPQLLTRDFETVDKKLRSLGKDVENGNSHPQASDISELQARYSELELKAIKTSTLSEARTTIARSEKRDAKDKAPLTLKQAKIDYDSALRAIEADRKNPASYQGAVSASLESARKLEQVLTTIDTTQATEAAAVKIYDQQQQLTQTRQSLRLAENQVSSERQTVNALQDKNDTYAAQADLNRRIQTVKGEFSPSEAEIFRDGNQIILRLKAIRFSTSRFELTPSSLATLQKVKDMIAAVPVEKVTVEGHTDNVGNALKNRGLSEQRAEIVKNYLVAENSIPGDKIEAHGFGYDKPLATNETPEGRAINRRVDVVIDTATP